jgi:hypothetical protein
MLVEQCSWDPVAGWRPAAVGKCSEPAQLVFVFGAPHVLDRDDLLHHLFDVYPGAQLVGCSTAGEIRGTSVLDDTLVATAVHFDATCVARAIVHLDDVGDSYEAGRRLARALDPQDLVHVLVFSDGLQVNGSLLVNGLVEHLPPSVTATGGLSGDGARMQRTLVCAGGPPEEGVIVAIGLYGSRLRVGYGSMGGWDPFGPERIITRSSGNVLYELDGQSALSLYKRYLGEYVAELPLSALRFPLSLRGGEHAPGLVRTVLAVNEDDQSMTFAGDVPEGSYARLMKANFDRLIDGAMGAARTSYDAIGSSPPDLALLISCVGRKLVLQQRIEEEVEAVGEVLGPNTVLTGFYSYGEISPFTPNATCELHNQTMTITTLAER